MIPGDLADKHLAKALKDEKKKDETKEKDKDKPRKKQSFRGGYRPHPYQGYQGYNPYGYGNPYQMGQGATMQPPAPPQAPGGYGAIPKTCTFCQRSGHFFRTCPVRLAAIPAAPGAPPK